MCKQWSDSQTARNGKVSHDFKSWHSLDVSLSLVVWRSKKSRYGILIAIVCVGRSISKSQSVNRSSQILFAFYLLIEYAC